MTRINHDPRWAESRETHPAVAQAIHNLATPERSADAIWDDATAREIESVEAGVRSLISAGFTAVEADGQYHWGQSPIRPFGGC